MSQVAKSASAFVRALLAILALELEDRRTWWSDWFEPGREARRERQLAIQSQ